MCYAFKTLIVLLSHLVHTVHLFKKHQQETTNTNLYRKTLMKIRYSLYYYMCYSLQNSYSFTLSSSAYSAFIQKA